MFELEVTAAIEVLDRAGLAGRSAGACGPGPTANVLYRLPTAQGAIEVRMMFVGTAIQTTAFLGNGFLASFRDANPATMEGARAAASKVLERLSVEPS